MEDNLVKLDAIREMNRRLANLVRDAKDVNMSEFTKHMSMVSEVIAKYIDELKGE